MRFFGDSYMTCQVMLILPCRVDIVVLCYVSWFFILLRQYLMLFFENFTLQTKLL